MSKFSAGYLREYVRVALTDKESAPWWAPGAKVDNSTFYAKRLTAKVVGELFGKVDPVRATVHLTYTDAEGNRQAVEDSDRSAIVNRKNGHVLGHGSDDRGIPNLVEYGVGITSRIAGDSLVILTAGLLDYGRQAFLTAATPEWQEVAGMKFRPYINFSTSFDGTWANDWSRGSTRQVCDNTTQVARQDSSVPHVRIRNSKNVDKRAKEFNYETALGLVERWTESDAAHIKALSETPVTDKQWAEFVALYVPIQADGSKRGVTMAENKRDALNTLYNRDPRCEPWHGTALGAEQTVNTYAQHCAIMRGAGDDGDAAATRWHRIRQAEASGKIAATDADAMLTLWKVLAAA